MGVNFDPNVTMPADLGHRLRAIRREREISQADAAAFAYVARTTLISVEQGQRDVRIRELQRLATMYGITAEDLLRPQAVFTDIIPHCRGRGLFMDPAVKDAVLTLDLLATAEAELEKVLGIGHATNYPMERPVLRGDVRVQAEQDARDVREWLGLEPATLPDMKALLSDELGVRVFERPLTARVQGLYVFDQVVGACAIVNAGMSAEAARFTAAFQLACMVSAREDVGLLLEEPEGRTRAFRYALAFARAFLMPPRAVMRQFETMARPGVSLTWQHIVALSAAFGVTHKTLMRRVEDLKLVVPCACSRLEAEGKAEAEAADAQQVRQPDANPPDAAAQPAPERLRQLAGEVLRRDLLTDGQLAAVLHLDRPAVRAMLAASPAAQQAPAAEQQAAAAAQQAAAAEQQAAAPAPSGVA
jgi:Zn-dependent peptidase ImmA (M78 family)/DNA-binding XRE family transcriptional regulator